MYAATICRGAVRVAMPARYQFHVHMSNIVGESVTQFSVDRMSACATVGLTSSGTAVHNNDASSGLCADAVPISIRYIGGIRVPSCRD